MPCTHKALSLKPGATCTPPHPQALLGVGHSAEPHHWAMAWNQMMCLGEYCRVSCHPSTLTSLAQKKCTKVKQNYWGRDHTHKAYARLLFLALVLWDCSRQCSGGHVVLGESTLTSVISLLSQEVKF